jgi:hypothetical protein
MKTDPSPFKSIIYIFTASLQLGDLARYRRQVILERRQERLEIVKQLQARLVVDIRGYICSLSVGHTST